MKRENRPHAIAWLLAMLATILAALIVSRLAGISWTMVRDSGISSAAYLGLFALAFGWPACILSRTILAKVSNSSDAIPRERYFLARQSNHPISLRNATWIF